MFSSIIISIGAVSAITVVLTIILIIAEATVGNYGQVKITINDKKELDIDGGKPLLSILTSNDIFIPSACGGRGACGLCKVKVEKGGGQILPTELPWLSNEEKADNIRLSCQFKVKQDIFIRIPEELFSVKRYKTQVISLIDLTHDIKQVTLQLLDPPEIEFRAGQFIQFEVPPYELTDESVYRAYSISSTPSVKNRIELEIRYVPNGICTTYVHRYLKEGEIININGPYGEFYLRDTDAEIICIAGGSGMAPIKSIITRMAETGNQRKITYIFGARTKRDLFLLDYMKELETKMPNFKFLPVLSSPEENDQWSGKTGLVTKIAEEIITQTSSLEAYLCGSPGMIDACVKTLTEKGLNENLIFYDKFA